MMLRLCVQRLSTVTHKFTALRTAAPCCGLSCTRPAYSKDEFVGLHPSQIPQHEVDWQEPPLPRYRERVGESADRQRARLQYQSRKRGITENGLLLSTFAAEYLEAMTGDQLAEYDVLINKPTNDWEIYYWATGAKPVPEEFDTPTFHLLKEHAKNSEKLNRTTQPETFYKPH